MSIDVTHCDLRTIASAAYELSSPQGMGFLHARPGGLDDESIDALLAAGDQHFPLDMDYVRGRAVKLHVRREGGRLTINDRWYDHSDEDLAALCKAIGAEAPTKV